MKNALLITLLTLTTISGSVSFAWSEKAPAQKNYSFKYKMKAGTFDYERTAVSYEEAYEAAAMACFAHYKGNRHLAEEDGLDIIDVCANPRS
jgi:hypothetical protein